jgi:GNAT superfamily N-acetyltransferase
VEIRDARLAEIAALEALQRRASTAWDDYRPQLLAHPDAIELPVDQVRDGLVRVAVDPTGGQLGFSVVLAVAGGVSELDGLFVEPAHWRRGIGLELVADAARRAQAAGAGTLAVIANPRAIGFYEAAGFVAAGMATTRFGPAPRMRRPL